MLKLTSRLSAEVYSPLCYVVASTDHTSADRIPKEGLRSGRCRVCTIPRSREVRRNHARNKKKTLEGGGRAADTSTPPWFSESTCWLADYSESTGRRAVRRTEQRNEPTRVE